MRRIKISIHSSKILIVIEWNHWNKRFKHRNTCQWSGTGIVGTNVSFFFDLGRYISFFFFKVNALIDYLHLNITITQWVILSYATKIYWGERTKNQFFSQKKITATVWERLRLHNKRSNDSLICMTKSTRILSFAFLVFLSNFVFPFFLWII